MTATGHGRHPGLPLLHRRLPVPAKRDTPFHDHPAGRQSGEIPVPWNAKGWQKYQAAGRPMTLEEYRERNMSMTNPLAQAGAIGPEQTTRNAAEHSGAYDHRPAPHLEPSPVLSPDHLAALAVESDGQAEADTEAEVTA
jgi:hypothetical protein